MFQDALTVIETNSSLSTIFDVLGLFGGIKERILFEWSLIRRLLVLLGHHVHLHAEDEDAAVAQTM